ncbi:EamA family transporter [Robbsia sp. KACC 23696]|uniref:DMT family transporter n=1 Tax=Robbsia sp. KACC 23696 TaxID=3149231 RepID=UPI00325B8925
MKLPARCQTVHLAEWMLLLVAIAWGSSYSIAKHAVTFYPVLGFLCIRFGLTFLLTSPAFLRLHRTDKARALKVGMPSGMILLAIFVCETFGVAQTSASNAAFLINLCVVITPFVEWGLLKRTPSGRERAAVLVSAVGALLITLNGGFSSIGTGDVLILAAACLRALMVCATKWLTRDNAVSPLALTSIQSLSVGIGSGIGGILFFGHGMAALPHEASFWLCTVYLVLVCTVFAFFAQNVAVQKIDPTRVSLLMGTEPVFGAVFACVWLHESVPMLSWLGGGLVVASALFVTVGPKALGPRPAPVLD